MSGARQPILKICFICSPTTGILDNWLPVICDLHASRPDCEFILIVPRARTVDEIDLSSVLVRIADDVFTHVLFKSHGGNWLAAGGLAEARRLNALGAATRALMKVVDGLALRPLTRPAAAWIAGSVRAAKRRQTAGRTVCVSDVLHPTAAVLFDVYEEAKDYNLELMERLAGVPKFSICHGIDIHGGGIDER